jgi:hypothetical protein
MYLQESMYTCGVIQLVYKQNTLSTDDIEYLLDFYRSLKGIRYSRYYNLFSVTRKDVPNNLKLERWLQIKEKLDKEGNGECITNYFLSYDQGSFTTLHEDSPHRVTKTAVTLVHKSADLIGGDILLSERVKVLNGNIHMPTDEDIVSKNEPVPLMRKVKSIKVVRQEIGETVWYPAQMTHGVSEVEQGGRLVLISWYKNK